MLMGAIPVSALLVACQKVMCSARLFFPLLVNDIDVAQMYIMKLFADDVKLYSSFDDFSVYLQTVCNK